MTLVTFGPKTITLGFVGSGVPHNVLLRDNFRFHRARWHNKILVVMELMLHRRQQNEKHMAYNSVPCTSSVRVGFDIGHKSVYHPSLVFSS
jgi:hypothetical protein